MTDFVDRIIRSAQLIRASYKVLDADGELLFLPVLSGVVTLIVGGLLVRQAIDFGTFEALRSRHDMEALNGFYLWLFGFYVAEYFIVFFFNTALVGAAIARLDGGDPTVGSALALAARRTLPILGYAIVAATVGMLLRMIADRVGFIGRLVAGGLGLAWTVATFLVVPILAAEGAGPVAAIEKSTELLRKTWGENIIGNAGISFIFSGIGVVIVLLGFGGGRLMLADGNEFGAMLVMIVAGMLLAAVAILGSALSGVYQAAVYYFAVIGEPPEGFDRDLIRDTFAPKGSG
jgi:hypothetical protein